MKVVVTEMPRTPEECLFSVPKVVRGDLIYVCTLRRYIPDEDTERHNHKPPCLCVYCSKCECLEVMK